MSTNIICYNYGLNALRDTRSYVKTVNVGGINGEIMQHTFHVGDEMVGKMETDTLEPPAVIVVAVAPGIYYRYINPTLVPDNDE